MEKDKTPTAPASDSESSAPEPPAPANGKDKPPANGKNKPPANGKDKPPAELKPPKGSRPIAVAELRQILHGHGYSKITVIETAQGVNAVCWPAELPTEGDGDPRAVAACEAAGLWHGEVAIVDGGVIVRDIRTVSEKKEDSKRKS